MRTYKEDQGRLARMFAFWGLVFVILYGCTFLHSQLVQHVTSLRPAIADLVIPVVGIAVSGAFLISATAFVVLAVWLLRWQAKPAIADILIDTESELRKSTWPTFTNVVNSTIVVVSFVLVLMGFLALVDWFLTAFFARLLGLGGS
ncbi:preprotein translocase subunit SecE [Engelhardtia mirabilis]|uniref:Protein translocase subunit SecE n=1 Tax=Engelhardtia mirabilis TaxID=2528011 RepID=A0A518BPE8_9BACT|nr:preprotein translocase subunit SecE [Planctomycetes bacterium Pla133]QDV03179.1 preprotein translocase subunit SecE [Planctomycetes bacterium Pla86]